MVHFQSWETILLFFSSVCFNENSWGWQAAAETHKCQGRVCQDPQVHSYKSHSPCFPSFFHPHFSLFSLLQVLSSQPPPLHLLRPSGLLSMSLSSLDFESSSREACWARLPGLDITDAFIYSGFRAGWSSYLWYQGGK